MDSTYIDDYAQNSYNQSSPRAIFLNGCLKAAVPPITAAMLRKKINSTMNLAHMGIGNTLAVILATAISNMPYLQALNLCDNNLEDSGLTAIIDSVSKHKDIQILDISQNIMNEQASASLAVFLGDPKCSLQVLRLSDSDIEDSECAQFVDVLMNNRNLKELDMSKNLLGKDENLNAVKPDCVTAGESLASLLRLKTCSLQTLNLHWNMIRLEGAEVLCESIRFNTTLVDLNLSYNAIGRAGANV
jgi:Ran GTPase-activating protein (RanGAP) involved in mRNA processing and transport